MLENIQMRYTEQRENDLFGSWVYDSEEDDYSKVLDVLNTEFRSFGDGMLALMEEYAECTITEPISYIKSMCEENRVPISAIGGRTPSGVGSLVVLAPRKAVPAARPCLLWHLHWG